MKINETEIFICSGHSARNLAYQGHSLKENEVSLLLEFTGQDVIGAKVKVLIRFCYFVPSLTHFQAPLSFNEEIYVLPMLTVSLEKTTGVVTSVPSDSPDDFASLRDLKNKPAFQEKFGVKPEVLTLFLLLC